MKKLLLKIGLFSLLVLIALVPVTLRLKNGFSDRFYDKFTHPANSMVLGSSRALLGLDPESIGETCPVKQPFLNFAFTRATSPYGETYYNAIKAKLGDASGGTFIVEVEPICISDNNTNTAEKQLILGRLYFFNMNPNLEYIARANPHPYYLDVFFNDKEPVPVQKLHPSGWLQNVKDQDSVARAKNIKRQISEYRSVFDGLRFSEYRAFWLEQTVRMLAQHGKVVLLRMPVMDKMAQMENTYMPDFNRRMEKLAVETGTVYVPMEENAGLEFNDLHHMTSASALVYSRKVGEALAKLWQGSATASADAFQPRRGTYFTMHCLPPAVLEQPQ